MEYEKSVICGEINQLDKAGRIQILTIIKNYDPSKIQRFADGSRINLDKLPDEVITTIYTKIKYILDL